MKKLKCNVGEYGVIVNQQWKFLILKLAVSKNFPKEAWMLPGGRLDVNDQIVSGNWLTTRSVWRNWSKNQRYYSCSYCFLGHWENTKVLSIFPVGKQDVKISHEHTESKWIKISDIEKISWHNINSKIAIKKTQAFLEKGF